MMSICQNSVSEQRMWLQVAEKYKDEPMIWFPHTMDFRGRAYPLPPHLNHLGSDTSRGVLQFAEGRMLGEHGLDWLCVQVWPYLACAAV